MPTLNPNSNKTSWKIGPKATLVFAAILLISLAGGWIGGKIANVSVGRAKPSQRQVILPRDSTAIAPLDETAQISGTTYTSLLHNFTISAHAPQWTIRREVSSTSPEEKIWDVSFYSSPARRYLTSLGIATEGLTPKPVTPENERQAIEAAQTGPDASLHLATRLSRQNVAWLMNAQLQNIQRYEDVTIQSREYVEIDGLKGSKIVYVTQPKLTPEWEKLQHKIKELGVELNGRPQKCLLTLLKHGDYVYLFYGGVEAEPADLANEALKGMEQIIGTFRVVDRNATSFAGISLDKERSEKLLQDQSVADLVEAVGKAVLGVTAYDRNQQPLSLGSGFLVTPSGVIVTNFHVVEGASSLTITLENGETYRGVQIIDVDPKRDIAVIKIEGRNLPSLELGRSSTIRTGERVIAVGSPEGFLNTVSDGLYNGLRELDDGMDWILTTAPISSGSSGGPLLNMDGSVIGITTASIEEGQNLNLCIPIEVVKGLISESPKRTFADLIPKIGLDDVKQSITQTARSANSLYQLGYYSECVQQCYLESYRLVTLIQSQRNLSSGLLKAQGILEPALKQAEAANSPESQASIFAQAFEQVLAL